MDRKNYDAIIIGFGKGGKTLAGALGSASKKTILVEQSDKMFGGTCINEGCIPSKFLIQKAKEAAKKQLNKEEAKVFFKKSMQEKETLINALRQKNYEKAIQTENVQVLVGKARLLSKEEVEVTTADGVEVLSGKEIFINTGAASIIPDIDGIQGNPYVYTSRELLSLPSLPEHLVIVGGGYIGMEFASMYRDFGSEVTIVIRDNVFLPREDREIAEAVKASLEKRGIHICMESSVPAIRQENSGVSVEVHNNGEVRFLQADAVLLATGRRPNTKDLGLENAGVEVNSRGGIVVDQHRRTNVSNIYAMGDVIGKEQFTYLSLDDYRIVKSQVLGDGSYTDVKRGVVPYSVFINPPFSRVGMTQKEAEEKGYSVKTANLSAMAIPKAKVLGQPEGLLKAVVDQNTGKILGAHLFCEESHEMINVIKLAIDQGASYEALRDMVFTHPTMGEALNDLFSGISI